MILPVVGCLLSLLASASALKTPASEDFYKAAVVEYHPRHGTDGNETLALNVKEYVSLIALASQEADIVVFPEAALLHSDFTVFLKVPIGNGSQAPADDPSLHPALAELSAAARNHSIYVTVNVHEEETKDNSTYRYNTNIVFDRTGNIIARYRKYNLFSEVRALNSTDSPEYVYFDTDFGVRFGTFTCFDILFKEPALFLEVYGVSDIIFPTWWFSELPFLTAVQEQAAWAYTTDSNLLASGGNLVDSGTSGSGIYAGRRGPIVYTQTTWNETLLLTATVYKKNKNGTSTGNIINPSGINSTEKGRLKMKTDKLDNYITQPLSPQYSDLIVSNNNFLQNYIYEGTINQASLSCFYHINITFTYTNTSSTNQTETTSRDDSFHLHEYRVGVFDGVRSFDGYATGGLQVCGVFSCLNGTLGSCGRPTLGAPPTVVQSPIHRNLYLVGTKFESLILKTDTLDREGRAQPSVLEAGSEGHGFGSLPRDFTFTSGGSLAELRIASDRLGTAAIFSRVFSRDGKQPGINSSASFLHTQSLITLIITLLNFYFCIM